MRSLIRILVFITYGRLSSDTQKGGAESVSTEHTFLCFSLLGVLVFLFVITHISCGELEGDLAGLRCFKHARLGMAIIWSMSLRRNNATSKIITGTLHIRARKRNLRSDISSASRTLLLLAAELDVCASVVRRARFCADARGVLGAIFTGLGIKQ